MQISQIYLSDSAEPLSPHISACIQSAKTLPTGSHVLYGIQSGRAFLAGNFPADVVAAYDTLKPYAYKADLLRYGLLYKLGGWYVDIAIQIINPIKLIDAIETFAFVDKMPVTSSQTNWTCQNALLYARPASPVYAKAIDNILENCRQRYYGINALCPTGPVVLGKAFAQTGESKERVFGDYTYLTPGHTLKNPAYVLPDGAILALGKQSALGGDLTALGAKGTNNYNDFYQSRTVYAD